MKMLKGGAIQIPQLAHYYVTKCVFMTKRHIYDMSPRKV